MIKEFISKMSAREKIGAAIAAAFVLTALVVLPVVSRVNLRIHQLNDEIKKDEKLLSEYLRYMNQKGIVTGEYEKYEKFVRKSGSDEEEQTKMLGEIEQLARNTGVSIVNMKPIAPRTVDYYKVYEVSIEAEGEMKALVDFIYQVSQSSQLLRAEKVSMNLKEKDSGIVKGSFSVTKVVIP